MSDDVTAIDREKVAPETAKKSRARPRKIRGADREKFAVVPDPSIYKNNVEEHEQQQQVDTQPTLVAVEASAADAAERIWQAWCDSPTLVGRRPRSSTAFTPKRRALVRRHLTEGFDEATLLDAVRGWTRSDFHRGVNANGKVYDSWELILRDAAHVDQFVAAWRGEDAPVGPMGETERAVRSDLALGKDTEQRARQRDAWRELRQAVKDASAGIPDHQLHPDFVLLKAGFVAAYDSWVRGEDVWPQEGWRDLLGLVPVLPAPVEPPIVSQHQLLVAKEELAAAIAHAGPARSASPVARAEVDAARRKVNGLERGMEHRAKWEAWAEHHREDAARLAQWSVLRSNAGLAELAQNGQAIDARPTRSEMEEDA